MNLPLEFSRAITVDEILVKKKQRARKEVVLDKIFDVLLADRKSPRPPLFD